MDFQQFCERYHVQLNEQQAAAVQRVNGATLLLAVPGSGKTTVIVARTGYMLHVEHIDPRTILTITYTKAAATEMKERFIQKFAMAGCPVPHFSTINSFCLSVIKACAREKGIRIPNLLSNNEPVIRDIARSMMREYPSDATIKALSQSIGKAKNELMTDEDLLSIEDENLDFAQFFHAYEDHLHGHGLMDFDDQLLMANQMLDTYPDILARAQRQFRYISLDEAQDTSLVQHVIVRKLVGRSGNIFMVGDEDQSIYSSRGAYPKALLNFQHDYADAKVIYMETNFRSDQAITSAANAFIKRNRERHNKEMKPFSREAGKIDYIPLADLKTQPRVICGIIREALANPGSSLAILYRNNYSAIPIINLLAREQLGVKTRDASAVFLTNFVVADIINFFRFAKDQTNLSLFRQLYYKLGIYVKGSVISSFESRMRTGNCKSVFDVFEQNPAAFRKLLPNLRFIRKAIDRLPTRPPLEGIDMILDVLDYRENWLRRKIDEGTSETLLMLKVNILKMVAMEYRTVDEFLCALERIRTYGGNPASNVTLSTIHSSKGLEFDRVILIDVFNGILPTTSATKEPEAEEEEVRLFYVGATRAKHVLDIVVPNAMFGTQLEPSEFLKDFGSGKQTQ